MKKLKNKISYFFLFLYLVIIFVTPPRCINYPRLLTISVIKYPLSFFNSLFYNLMYIARSKGLIAENKMLSDEISELRANSVELEELKAENSRLKDILSYKSENALDFLTCPVIAKDSSSFSGSITIGRGARGGVKKDNIVMTKSGVVGRVIEITPNTARVLLITDPNSRISAMISRTRCEGMLYGILGGFCKLMYLPLDANVQKGDIVVTSGFGSLFPKGFMLGEVIKTATDTRGMFVYALVRPVFDLTRLEEVLCLK